MIILFKDGQSLDVESISTEDGALHIKILNSAYPKLKALFTDPVATAKIEIPDRPGEVYENYTVFSYIKETGGGIFDVEMLQNGADVNARLTELENGSAETKEQGELLIGCILELTEEVYK